MRSTECLLVTVVFRWELVVIFTVVGRWELVVILYYLLLFLGGS